MSATAFSDRGGTMSAWSLRTRHQQMRGCVQPHATFSPLAGSAPCAHARGPLGSVIGTAMMLIETMGT
jgi:hypothetical protein